MMQRRCEICSVERGKAPGRSRICRVLVEGRIVALCEKHAALAVGSDRLDELAATFRESTGRRSLLPRRSPLDRRVFPPRPEGRRRGDGRRVVDQRSGSR
jgi:hypothetical protein